MDDAKTVYEGALQNHVGLIKQFKGIIPYNGYFLRLEIFAIWAPKRSILIFAFLIFAIPVNRKNWLMDIIFIHEFYLNLKEG